MRQSRKLTAIMFTDIEGYTALMQQSERSAINVRNRHRAIFEDATSAHQGSIIQYYGDGTLSIFESAVLAVQCAIEMQKQFREQPAIPVRIGIHVGDIVVTDDDIIGDAVNLASRVESLAVAGSVLLSAQVVEELKNHNEISVKSLGRFHFKNDKAPREVFAVDDKALAMPRRSQIRGKTVTKSSVGRTAIVYTVVAWLFIQLSSFLIDRNNLDPGVLDLIILLCAFGFPAMLIFSWFKPRLSWIPVLMQSSNIALALFFIGYYLLNPTWIEPSNLRLLNPFDHRKKSKVESLKSIAVLPFSNYMGDDDTASLLAGMQHGLITEIGKLRGIRVISRTSTLRYANTNKSIQAIGDELDVDAIIEASLTRIDSVVALRLNLVSVSREEDLIWSHSYQSQWGDIPSLYRDVTKNVAQNIEHVIQPPGPDGLMSGESVNPEVYKASLRGRYFTGFLTREGFQKAEEYCQKAIDLDPAYAPAYVGMANIWFSMKQVDLVAPREADPRIREFLEKAIQLDSTNAEIWAGYATLDIWTDHKWAEGERAFQRSIELNPNNSLTRASYAHYLMIRNRWDEAWEQMNYATAIDPENPWVIAFSAVMYFNEGKILSGTREIETLKEMVPDHPFVVSYLIMKYASTFREGRAIEQFKKLMQRTVGNQLNDKIDEVYATAGYRAAIRAAADALEQRRDTAFVSPFLMLRISTQMLNDKKKGLDWLEVMYEENDPNLPYASIKREGDPLQRDPRYISIMEEIGLWR